MEPLQSSLSFWMVCGGQLVLYAQLFCYLLTSLEVKLDPSSLLMTLGKPKTETELNELMPQQF